MKATPKTRWVALFASFFALAALVLPAAAETVYFDDFNDQQNINNGGPYTQTLAGSTTTTGGGTWLAGVEVGGWGQRNWDGAGGVATPTSSNFLAFTPDPGRIYTVQATIDTTGAAGLGTSWFTLGFTSSQHNWDGSDSATIDTGHLVRFNDATVSTITYTIDGATLSAAGVGFVGWITDLPGGVNLNPANAQVKIDNFTLISGVANPTVTYDGNGSDGGTVPADGSSPYTHSATVTVLGAGTMTRTGFTFTGWNTAVDGSGTDYSESASFTIYDNTTLYAQWISNSAVTLTYDGNGDTGGSAPVDPNNPYISGDTATVLGAGTLTKNSYSFDSWNTASDGSGTSYAPDDTFTLNANTTLYAQWTPGPDYVWDNGASTDNWNTTDSNWSGPLWSNSATNNAIFTTVGGSVFLDPGIVAGAVGFGNTAINSPNTDFYDGDLTAASLTVQGSSSNGGGYGSNPILGIDSTVTITGDAAVGRASLEIFGGSFTADRIISAPASADWGRLLVSGGVVTATNGVDGSVNTSATFAIDLNGGELRTPSINVADREQGTNNTAVLTFNGGILTATGADNPNFIQLYGGGGNTFVAPGGAIIDTNGLNIGINANLLDAGGGNLTKQGVGTLTLGGQNTYAGDTNVNGGTLDISATGSLRFYPSSNGITNAVSGSGSLSFLGTVDLDLGSADIFDGNTWTLFSLSSYAGLAPLVVTSTAGSFVKSGTTWTLVDGDNTWTFEETTGLLSLEIAAGDPFLAWIDATWPGLSDKTAEGDPENDGIANIIEYILLDGDPSVASPGILPTIDASGGNFIFSFSRRNAATVDTTQTFQYGDNLGGWSDVPVVAGTYGDVTVAITPDGVNDDIVITVPMASNTKLFGRLRVTKP